MRTAIHLAASRTAVLRLAVGHRTVVPSSHVHRRLLRVGSVGGEGSAEPSTDALTDWVKSNGGFTDGVVRQPQEHIL